MKVKPILKTLTILSVAVSLLLILQGMWYLPGEERVNGILVLAGALLLGRNLGEFYSRKK